MGGSAPSMPPATPPDKVSRADTEGDILGSSWAMAHGMPDYFTPGGSRTVQKGDVDPMTLDGKTFDGLKDVQGITTQFSPALQQTWNTLEGKGSNLAQALPSDAFNPNINTDTLRQSYVNRAYNDIQRTWNDEDNKFIGLMADRGIPIGSEIWNNELGEISENRNKFAEGVTNSAEQAAANDETRQFQLALAQHNVPFNDVTQYANLLSGMQANLTGGEAPLIPVNGINVDTSGNYHAYDAQNAQNAAYAAQAQSAGLGGLFQGLGSLGGALLMRSDARIKEDIEPVGKTNNGLTVYRFRFKDDPFHVMQIGLMAQEVEKTIPEAVHEIDGVKHVDYAMATDPARKRA